jgi:hypothetical protein
MKKFITNLLATLLIIYLIGANVMGLLNTTWLQAINPFSWPWEIVRLLIFGIIILMAAFSWPYFGKNKKSKYVSHLKAREMRELIEP